MALDCAKCIARFAEESFYCIVGHVIRHAFCKSAIPCASYAKFFVIKILFERGSDFFAHSMEDVAFSWRQVLSIRSVTQVNLKNSKGTSVAPFQRYDILADKSRFADCILIGGSFVDQVRYILTMLVQH